MKGRAGWLALIVAAVLVFLFFGAGTAYSLLTPDYAFADGELLGEAVILTGSLALAAFGARRLRAADVRLRDSVPDFGAWLPGSEGSRGAGRVDLDAQTARLRRTALRATAIAGAWAVLFAGGLATVIAAERAAADLLATGSRVEGEVLSVFDPVEGTPSIRVRYDLADESWTEEIVVDSGDEYHVGEPVTVVYDPADPGHVRTTVEANENRVLAGFGVGLLVACFIGLPFAAKAAAGWRRRARAVSRTGWRVATVTVAARVQRSPEVLVRFRDGSGIVLHGALSTHGLGAQVGLVDRRAWIGGWGRQMVVLFPYGPRKPGPYAVPVRATGERVSRSRP